MTAASPFAFRAVRSAMVAAAALLAVATLCSGQGRPAAKPVRERVRFNAGWRFLKGDPPGVDASLLLYDVRPVARAAVERPAEFTEAAEKLAAATHPVLKPYILPSGNPYIKDAAKRYMRPSGNPGGDVAYVQAGFDDSGWKKLDLPHDWAIEGPFETAGGGGMGRLPSAGIAWYRKKLEIAPADAGKQFALEVEGAMSYAAVWVNGQLAGGWPYGYTSWSLDITPYVKAGENQIAIRLDNPPNSSRWYPGAGIYRDVYLVKTGAVRVAPWGSFVTTPEVSAEKATVAVELNVENASKAGVEVTVGTEIFALSASGVRGPRVAAIAPAKSRVAAGSASVVKAAGAVTKPLLWGPPPQQKPNRYVAVSTVSVGGKVVDRYESPFGIRTVEFKADGVFVNGQRIQLHGVNQHHDLGALGSAFNVRAAERQLEVLREMGCNAIRTSHNPPAPELLELTDRMGFLVMDELYDAWHRQKTPFDFHLIFDDWHEQDLRAWMRRDHNHPSVILWSVGNEVGEQNTGEEGAAIARELVALAHDEDPTRKVTASMNSARAGSPFAAAVDVIALNYQGEGIRDSPAFTSGIKTPPQYPAFREKHPGKTILSSESAAALSSRGVYEFPVAKELSNPVRDGSGGDSKARQVSAYELYAADFGSSVDKVFATVERHPFVAGEFVWSGWDYLGEPTPYNASRSSYFGIIDLAGFPKDRYFAYQAHWRPEVAMAHILPHWTWPDRVGQVTPVHVFTSGDEAELFLNGKSLGRKKKQDFEYRLRWDDAVYAPGELKVVAYKGGKPWATDVVRTAEAAAQLAESVDRGTIRADGLDLAFVTVEVRDATGVPAPQAANRVRFRVEGPGEIVATDNGDSTNMEPLPARERAAFNGRVLAIVRGVAGKAGEIRVIAESDGLKAATVAVKSVR